LPSKIQNVIRVGKITSDYKFDGTVSQYQHYRDVEWFEDSIPKAEFDQDIIYTMGAMMTICRIKQEERVIKIVTAYTARKSKNPPAVMIDPDRPRIDVEGEALDEIRDYIIQKTKGHKLSNIIASILRAKGFTTNESPAGPDKGVDILASPGILGFGQPKICVQVKSTDTPTDRMVLDQLVGVMKKFGAEYGLLVSWGGFKNSVISETAAQFFSVRLWTQKEVVDEFLAHYEKLEDEIKGLIPLKRIWVLNPELE
jgi:restriction system protein